MKHTDLYSKYKELEEQEMQELHAAVMAHGGEYHFPDNCLENPQPVICASLKHDDHSSDFYVTSVKVSGDGVIIYGEAVGDSWHEGELHYIEFGHLGFITDVIPETEDVKDVSGKC